jgi:hypothetical protein
VRDFIPRLSFEVRCDNYLALSFRQVIHVTEKGVVKPVGVVPGGVRRKFGTNDVITRVINGRVALVALVEGIPRRVVSIDVSKQRIAGIYVVANPEKLRPLSRSLYAN